jgi:hypothetical protein
MNESGNREDESGYDNINPSISDLSSINELELIDDTCLFSDSIAKIDNIWKEV